MDREMILEILKAFDQSTVSTFELSLPGGKIALSKEQRTNVSTREGSEKAVSDSAGEAENVASINAPLVGIYYEAPAPDAPPFLRPGDRVEVGQVIGIIEAMKVMNEITSKVKGRVLSIEKEDGALCAYGDVLVRVEVDA